MEDKDTGQCSVSCDKIMHGKNVKKEKLRAINKCNLLHFQLCPNNYWFSYFLTFFHGFQPNGGFNVSLFWYTADHTSSSPLHGHHHLQVSSGVLLSLVLGCNSEFLASLLPMCELPAWLKNTPEIVCQS